MKYIVYTDGGSRGNPGPSAIGVVVQNEQGETIKKHGQCVENGTNNEAEYQAVIFALKKTKALFGGEKAKGIELFFKIDSELVVKQLNHQYKIQEQNIQQLFLKVWNLMLDFKSVSFSHIPREQNTEADRLVNEALDKKQGELF